MITFKKTLFLSLAVLAISAFSGAPGVTTSPFSSAGNGFMSQGVDK